MALAARNAQCPCGSGRKYKTCCGFDRVAERALEDRLAAIEEVARLAFRSPRLLPDCDAYDDWVRGILAGEVPMDANAAIVTLGREEPQRILAACLDLFPDEWSALSGRCGSDRDAVAALLGGAVAAGIRDHRPPRRSFVELVEESEDLGEDPFEALALCLDGEQLWSGEDGIEAERAIDAIPDWVDDDVLEIRWRETLDAIAAREVTDWHARRLTRLVERLERQLPFEGFPRASAAIRAECEQFAADESFRRGLASRLLGHLVGRQQIDELRAALFAA